MRSGFRLAVLALALGTFPGCGGSEAPPPTLFERLGGVDGVRPVVESAVANAGADDRINAFFAGADEAKMAALKEHLVNLLCRETGGGCTYTGRDMRTAHAGLSLTDAHFDALAEDIQKALGQHNVPQQEQKELLAVLERMRSDVLNR